VTRQALRSKILVSEEKEQIIEVEFDQSIDSNLLANLAHLKTYKNTNDNLWLLTFTTEEDMRPKVFDFAHDNGLKTLQISLKSKNLEQIFREKTKKK
jgi:ABC-2 type transport system ATP-binding protein